MQSRVSEAFRDFLRNHVNLAPDVVSSARESRDNLLKNISELGSKDNFFTLCSDFDIQFGSFARKTKCTALDDIDLMIGLSAGGAYYTDYSFDDVEITAGNDQAQLECTDDGGILNSRKVLNKFKKQLELLWDYSRSEIKRNGEAITLNLKSKEWSFDIVPCFYTVPELDGRNYYLIPNGKGGWQKTAPDKDREHVSRVNQDKGGRVLELVRLCKKWNELKKAKTIPSYLLETMIIEFAESQEELAASIEVRFRDALCYIAENITRPVYDMKDIQGDINNLGDKDKFLLGAKAKTDYKKACRAVSSDDREALKMWGEILGGDFTA